MLIAGNVADTAMWNERQAIEVFHLLFLRAFGARADKALYVLKGGCNLRFFLKSIRYSEGMDIDIHKMSVATLANNVKRVIEGRAFLQTLRSQQIDLVRVSAPKQTATVQRWKLSLRLTGTIQEIPTKIEFSRRALDTGRVHEPVDADIIHRYRMYPVLVQHYSMAAAFDQKVIALALRSETQARDVFDLKLLLDGGAGKAPLAKDVKVKLTLAVENAMTVGYDAFAGQVLAYLEPEYQSHYRERTVWESLQEQVIESLEGLRS
jgi:predicted nucleotidyltransferase component of viral defense system